MTLSDAAFLLLYQVMDGEVSSSITDAAGGDDVRWVTTARDTDRDCTHQLRHLMARGLVQPMDWNQVTIPVVTDSGRRLLRETSVYEVLERYKRG